MTELDSKKYPYRVMKIYPDADLPFYLTKEGTKTEIVACGPQRIFLTDRFLNHLWDIYNFEPRPDDVWLFGFPRSGTTVLQEALWLIGNDLDYERAGKDVLDIRFPIIGSEAYLDGNSMKNHAETVNASEDVKNLTEKYTKIGVKYLATMEGRRFLKSHIPPSLQTPKLFDSGAKIVFIVRNPKDTIVSNYHIYKLFSIIDECFTLEQYVKLFRADMVLYTPYFGQIKEFWQYRNHKNCLFIFYEELRQDLGGMLRKIAEFLGKNFTEEEFVQLEEHLSIDKFKSNKTVNNDHFLQLGMASKTEDNEFIRKGEVNGWRKYFTDEMNEQVDKWIEDNLKGTDIIFPGM